MIINGSRGQIYVSKITSDQVQPNSIDLTLDKSFMIPKWNLEIGEDFIIDFEREMRHKVITVGSEDDGRPNKFYLPAKSFVLASTLEELNVPNGVVGIICGKSSNARRGLVIEAAGFVDSGFIGNITLELYNQNRYDIAIRPGMKICQVYFLDAEHAEKLYGECGNRYQGQSGVTGARVEAKDDATTISSCPYCDASIAAYWKPEVAITSYDAGVWYWCKQCNSHMTVGPDGMYDVRRP